MTTAPLQWIKQIESTLIDLKQIPLHGYAPSFPWEDCSHAIGALLGAPELTIAMRSTRVASAADAKAGLGASPIAIALELTPLIGQAFFLMGKEEVEKLCALTLTESVGSKGIASPQLQEGFYYFLAQKAISALSELNPFEDLALKMAKFHHFADEESLCIDVEIRHPKHTFWGRVVCPSSFHSAFKAHFSEHAAPSLEGPIAEKIPLSLSMEVGRTVLTPLQLKRLSSGDFLVLDRCTFDPATHKGTLTLRLHDTPLLRARIKEGNLKIVDYAFYHEEQHPMTPHSPEDEELSSKEPIEEEELPLEQTEEEGHLWNSENVSDQPIEKMISPNEIPITISVEASRIQMSLARLLELSPGNVIEFPAHPEQGVDLVVNGKKIGKGELVKLGEVIGVKILQIGD
ncbi:MAG: type III secretion system cytoplasmic ring protein SctQ [Chlamydiota bacterium]